MALKESKARALPWPSPSQELKCRLHPARAVWHAGHVQTHLHPAQGTHQHQVGKITKVADSEYAVVQRAQAVAQAHVESLQYDRP